MGRYFRNPGKRQRMLPERVSERALRLELDSVQQRRGGTGLGSPGWATAQASRECRRRVVSSLAIRCMSPSG